MSCDVNPPTFAEHKRKNGKNIIPLKVVYAAMKIN
jgi:hypothetical protein